MLGPGANMLYAIHTAATAAVTAAADPKLDFLPDGVSPTAALIVVG